MNATRWVGTPGLGGLMELSRLKIRETKSGNVICLLARKETAEFYGWTNHFERHIPGYYRDEATGVEYMNQPQRGRSKARFGMPIVISRHVSKSARKRTYTNQFRVSGEATITDLAQIAEFTDVDWYWMETPSGERRTREKWLSIHEAHTRWREGGVVSL